MPLTDPAQLLQRIPELHALTDDHRIRRAIESGNPFKLYRALVLAYWFRRLPEHRELLRLLTASRRLFAQTAFRQPYLRSIQSVGLSMVGESENDVDDTYVATHAVAIGARALIPLGNYVVKSTGAHQWQIEARAPLSAAQWLYSRSLALAALAAALAAGAYLYHGASTQELLVVNGFDVPLTVQFDHQSMQVAPQSRAAIRLKLGKINGVAIAGKSEVMDTLQQTLTSNQFYSVWNIAGAAPLLLSPSVYNRNAPLNLDMQDEPTVLCGKRFIQLDHVQYAFERLPETVKMSGQQDRVVINHLSIIDNGKQRGVQYCIPYTFDQGNIKESARMLEAHALLHDWDAAYASAAIAAAQSVSNEEAGRVAQRVIEAKPGDLTTERMVQDARADAGHLDDLLAEYGARAKLNPRSSRDQYLYASLLSGVAGIKVMQDLAEQFPGDPDILRSLVWRKAVHGDFQGASRSLALLKVLSPKDASRLFDIEVRLLIAQRKGFDAMNLLGRAVRDKVQENRAGYAAEFGLVARHFGADPEQYLKALPGDEQNRLALDFYRVRGGLQPILPSSALVPSVKLGLALRNAPDKALAAARELNRTQLASLGNDQLTLLIGEASRTDDRIVLAKTNGLLHLTKIEETVLQQFMLGDAVSLDSVDLNLDIQAAAYFIRSRNPQLSAAERANLRSRAASTDLLRGVVSLALRQW